MCVSCVKNSPCPLINTNKGVPDFRAAQTKTPQVAVAFVFSAVFRSAKAATTVSVVYVIASGLLGEFLLRFAPGISAYSPRYILVSTTMMPSMICVRRIRVCIRANTTQAVYRVSPVLKGGRSGPANPRAVCAVSRVRGSRLPNYPSSYPCLYPVSVPGRLLRRHLGAIYLRYYEMASEALVAGYTSGAGLTWAKARATNKTRSTTHENASRSLSRFCLRGPRPDSSAGPFRPEGNGDRDGHFRRRVGRAAARRGVPGARTRP